MSESDIIKIGVIAGVVSAMIPSIPTVVRFWADEKERNRILNLWGFEIRQWDFMIIWLILTVIIIIVIFVLFRKK